MNEFKINKFLKLRLENSKTIIFVDDKRVIQCKYLLLSNSSKTKEDISLNKINVSVDDVADNLDHSLEINDDSEIEVPPEAEFWAHSSNLQVWYENKYDTHVLHSNLAFPLLRKLTMAGDKIAKEVFKKEIIKRFRSKNLNVMTFLIKEGYLDELDIEESEALYQELDFKTYRQLQKMLQKSNEQKEGFVI